MQKYHTKATTNISIRTRIQDSSLSNSQLAKHWGVNVKTIIKWKKRYFTTDKSSRPKTIHYSLSYLEKQILCVIRKLTGWSKEDVVDAVVEQIPRANPSNIYRTWKENNLNKLSEEQKRISKQFKDYNPGFLHVDVTYLPTLDGQKYYLFVAIDRATRTIYFQIYENKTAINAYDFLKKCNEYFPFPIDYILTDNGFEFTDKFISTKKKDEPHKFDKLCQELSIEHRTTKPNTPQTNGMVEKANDIIKSNTIKVNRYKNLEEMKEDLTRFLKYYNLSRPHGGLRRQKLEFKDKRKVRTPIDAIYYYYEIHPEIFKCTPYNFKYKISSITL